MGQPWMVKPLWSDSVLDLAIVKVNATGLTAIPLGDASNSGRNCIAIGNPFGLTASKNRPHPDYKCSNRTITLIRARNKLYGRFNSNRGIKSLETAVVPY